MKENCFGDAPGGTSSKGSIGMRRHPSLTSWPAPGVAHDATRRGPSHRPHKPSILDRLLLAPSTRPDAITAWHPDLEATSAAASLLPMPPRPAADPPLASTSLESVETGAPDLGLVRDPALGFGKDSALGLVRDPDFGPVRDPDLDLLSSPFGSGFDFFQI